MGIKKYYEIVIKKEENGDKIIIADFGVRITPAGLKNKNIIMDVGYFIHNAVQAFNNPLKDSKGNITAHINTIFNKILIFKKMKVNQIWVFDPTPDKVTPLKLNELQKRRNVAANSTTEKGSFRIKEQHINDIKDLLSYMGISYLQSPDYVEAEQYGSFLCKHNIADYMLTTDVDVIAFGGNLLKEVKQKTKTYYDAYNYDDVLRKTNLTSEQHTTMCVAMGCDFAPKVDRIGVAGVMKKIQSNSIELNETQQLAYDYFMEDISKKNKKELLIKNTYNKDKLITFFRKYEFNIDRIEKRLVDY